MERAQSDSGVRASHALSTMFHPRAVALVGASGRPEALLARPLRYLRAQGYAGDIFPVNPGYTELDGRPCYPSLAALPGPVDLVLIMVPAVAAPDVVRQAGAIGATAAVVFASGFAETGPEGAALQEELRAAARDSGVRVLGPNCQGLLYASNGLAATFTAAADRPLTAPSGVAYVGQSGAVGGSILDLAEEMGLGLSAWVSTGNQADLDLVEVASVLVDDPDIDVCMLYIEAMADGAAYCELARRAQANNTRLIVLRAGRSHAGRRAVASHTGAMVADDAGFVLASERFGVMVVDDVDDLLATAALARAAALPRGRRVAVVTTSGGAGGLAADRLEDQGLNLPELTAPTQARLEPLIPAFGALANPVDVTAQLFNQGAHAFADVCRIVAEDPDVDAVAVLLTMVVGEPAAALADDLLKSAADLDKPLLVAWLAGHQLTVDGRRVFRDAGIPIFSSVASLSRVLAVLASGGTRALSAEASAPVEPPWVASLGTLASSATPLTQLGPEILDAAGIAQPRSLIATTRDEAAAAAEQVGTCAMKLHAPELAHKSDVGGVALGVTAADAAATFDRLLGAARDHGVDAAGVQLQQMVPSGLELIVGVVRATDGFPPLLTVGMGGVTTEIYRDVVSAFAPVGRNEAVAMLGRLQAWPLLDGFRGAPPVDVDAAADAVVALSWAAVALGDAVAEMEINPLIVAPAGAGAVAVDVLVRTGDHPDLNERPHH
ncbi:MAG: acetate--CoA ligase family protein [Acidimicrobiales bacterium]